MRSGRLDPVALVEAALERLAAVDGEVGAFVHVDAARARVDARSAPDGPLRGVPVAVKDLFDVAGEPTPAGSQVPPGPATRRDAVAVARLRAAGAVVLGRTRTHEFAWGITTQHAVLGGTRNPWDTARVPGGSSGGSAAAVAAGVVPLALGTDTGCSIRLPATWCGLVGHKPTHGAVPLDGCVPLAPSLDTGGAVVRTVEDARLALRVLARLDLPAGSTAGLRLGVAGGATAPGAVEVEVPLAGLLAEVYGTVSAAEALTWHRGTGRWPASADRYGPDVRGHLERAEATSPERVEQARRRREQLRREVAELFRRVDVLVLPVAVAGPPPVADLAGAGAGAARDAVLPWTVLANLCGLPACAVPVGTDADGIPVGVQVLGPRGGDARVLDVAEHLQRALPWG